MSRVMYLESHNHKEDNQAATSIIFEISKSSSDKIVWFSNLTAIVDSIKFEIRQNSSRIDLLKNEINSLKVDLKNITDGVFLLKDSIDKLDRKLKKNHYKMGDILNLLKPEDIDVIKMDD